MLRILWWTSFEAWRLGMHLVLRLANRRNRPLDALLGQSVVSLLTRLGPAFVKLGQVLGSRRDLLSDGIVRELMRLQDQLPPLPTRMAKELIRAELHSPVALVFSEFCDTPVASGSVATVYRARLRDGRLVAVKLLRPGAQQSIDANLLVIRRLARALEHIPGLRTLPLVESIDEVGAYLRHQADFLREADANRRLRAAFSRNSSIVIPALVDALCTPSMLTMEYLHVFETREDRRAGPQRMAVGTGLRALYQMIFVEGLVHCDMHEGNFRCLPDGRVALIDFGFVANLSDATRRAFAEFFFALAAGDGAWCADIALDLAARYPRNLDRRAFTAEIAAVVAAAAGRPVGEFSVARFVGNLFAVQRRYRVRATPAFVTAIVGLLVLEGLVNEMAVDLDFQREALPFIAAANIWESPTRAGGPERVKRVFARRSTYSARPDHVVT